MKYGIIEEAVLVLRSIPNPNIQGGKPGNQPHKPTQISIQHRFPY